MFETVSRAWYGISCRHVIQGFLHHQWYEPQLSRDKKGKVHIVEVHYDSEDWEVHENATTDAYLDQ